MIPDGEPIPMNQFEVGKSYGPFDFARDCGCEHCLTFLAQHGRRQIFTDQLVDALESENLTVTYRRWMPSDDDLQ